jgi:hypothetical protein
LPGGKETALEQSSAVFHFGDRCSCSGFASLPIAVRLWRSPGWEDPRTALAATVKRKKKLGRTNVTISILKSHRPLVAAAMLAAIAASGCATAPAGQSGVAERLQALEDKEAIHALLERFFEYQETRQIENYANLFAKDGEMILRRGRTSGGPAGIIASMTRGGSAAGGAANAPAAPAAAPAIRMRHILSNVHVEVKGDVATAQSRFTLISVGDDNRPRVGGSGRYRDDLVRENGQWKILKRVIYRDIPLDVEGANPEPE